MFVACPHCQFLVARDPQVHTLPAHCTRCGKPLPAEDAAAPTPSPSLATFLHPAPSPDDEAVTDAPQAPSTIAAIVARLNRLTIRLNCIGVLLS